MRLCSKNPTADANQQMCELRGLALFAGKADCVRCHEIENDYALFVDFKHHNLGVGYQPDLLRYDDLGLGGISNSGLNL